MTSLITASEVYHWKLPGWRITGDYDMRLFINDQ